MKLLEKDTLLSSWPTVSLTFGRQKLPACTRALGRSFQELPQIRDLSSDNMKFGNLFLAATTFAFAHATDKTDEVREL